MTKLKVNITADALTNPKMNLNFNDLWVQTHADEASPTIYHRWTSTMMIATLLSRNVYLNFHGTPLYPNMYSLLVGIPATRKTTALEIGKNLLSNLGYPGFAPSTIEYKDWPYLFSASYKEAQRDGNYVASLSQDALEDAMRKSGLSKAMKQETASASMNLMGANTRLDTELEALLDTSFEERVNEVGVWSLEFADTFAVSQDRLISSLTEMFDTHTLNRHRFDAKSVAFNPVVNLIGCIAPATLADKFDPKSWEGGFLTRTILVHGAPTHVSPNMFDAPLNPMLISMLLYKAAEIRNLKGEMILSNRAKLLLTKISEIQPKLTDVRLQAYNGRRFTHLLKMCMIRAAGDNTLNITDKHVMWANTLLTFTEMNMGKALGEFGSTPQVKLRNSAISILAEAGTPLTSVQLEKAMSEKTGEDKSANIYRAIADLKNEGAVITLTSGAKTVYALPKEAHSKILDLDGKIIDTSLMLEWDSISHPSGA